jgi:GDPmannose 4,6-dehydratase
MTKTALITGVNGQDGSYLADLLLSKGYKVYGMERRCSTKNRINTSHLEGKITFINGDLADQNSLFRCLRECDPDEVYNLGAMSFVGESWNTPETTGNINGIGVLRILEAIREYNKSIKFYQASTSEMFGKVTETPQRETTPFYPRSPYGVSKLYGYWITKNYRESYGMFACNGILFNHESERRGKEFVTRKISDGVAKISLGLSTHIHLGNLDAKRDWGYAPDYVDAMWRMLQQDTPRDFVISTGETYSIKDFLEKSFRVIGITDWEKYVKYDERFMRPSEVDYLIGDFSKAKKFLNWEPTISFEEMIDLMVNNDIKLLSTSV